MTPIDLRSDTTTLPTAEMKNAMMEAQVGDDVFREDPATLELEEYAARLFGMEAALFCPSGTMTNQIAIKLHTQPGDEVICDELAHVYQYEGGGIAFNSGCSVQLLHGDRGRFTAEDVQGAINNPKDVHKPLSRLVVVENTCNKGGGAIWDFNEIKAIRQVCNNEKLKFHLDGARLFNAIVETNIAPGMFGNVFDTISICLSKGLGAPVGSLLIGSKNDMLKARRIRKVFGGGMRQSGFIASAGLYALKNHVERLKEDHSKAKELEAALGQCSWVKNILTVESNIVIFDIREDLEPETILQKLATHQIKAVPFGPRTIRMVTHLNISNKMIKKVTDVLKELEI